MTLAIFVLSLRFFTFAPDLEAHTTQSIQNAQSAQDTVSQPPAANPQSSSGTPSSQMQAKQPSRNRKKRSTSKRHSSKKTDASPCVLASETTASISHPQNASTDSAGQASTAQSGVKEPAKDCPPPKIVVRQGGTKDPSIQLAGGDANQAAQKRDNVNQLLGQTDQNLKKAGERQLTASQQEIVTQARQYVTQSKTAMANGDFERARTLAWKAQLLSQDLANPPK